MTIIITIMKIYSQILLVAIIGLAVITSGCTGGQDVTSVVKALPEVQQFMNEHPNAKITVTYWSKEEVAQSAQEISQQCGKPITSVAMYKAIVSEGDLKIVSWINAENQIVLCSTTTSSGGASPIVTPNQGTQANKFEILNLDVQQVILSDSEIKEVIGPDWEETNQTKYDIPNQGPVMYLGYQTTNSNTGDKEYIDVRVGVTSNISRETFSRGLSNSPGNYIDIGDAGKVDTRNNQVGIIFIKNNIMVIIVGSTNVGLETITNLARKQEEKIIGLLENPTSASAFTPIPVSTLPGQMNSKASSTTKESSTAIGENLNIVAIDGVDNSTALTALSITIQAAPGSSSIDLSKVLLKVQGQNYNYNAFGSGATGNVFQVYVLKLSNPNSPSLGNPNSYSTLPNPSIDPGDLARLDVDVTSLGLTQNTPITISLTPQSGATMVYPITLPAFTAPAISIYP